MQNGSVLSITEVNNRVKLLLDSDKILADVFVKGEISNYKLHTSGHHYMTLKDENSAISAVMFRFDASKLKFRLENGMNVIVRGRVSVFPKSGQYQLYISELAPDGIGALYMAFEQLKEKLFKEGLFDAAHKKAIPKYPESIALITSPTGAAVRDMLRILKCRFPIASVTVFPVKVQGEGAEFEISGMIKYVNDQDLADVIITGRGGGSIEDLWAFNTETVARAIYISKIPVISAVGHEPDITISDFVADLRAATPSNAAELVCPDMADIKIRIKNYNSAMATGVKNKIGLYKEKILSISEKNIMKSPVYYIQDRRMALSFFEQRISSVMNVIINKNREKFIKQLSLLDAMSPLKVLKRGYSIVLDGDERIIRDSSEIKIGTSLTLKFHKGSAKCEVLEKLEDKSDG